MMGMAVQMIFVTGVSNVSTLWLIVMMELPARRTHVMLEEAAVIRLPADKRSAAINVFLKEHAVQIVIAKTAMLAMALKFVMAPANALQEIL